VAHFFQLIGVITPEIGDGFKVGDQFFQKPSGFQVSSGFGFQPPGRAYLVFLHPHPAA